MRHALRRSFRGSLALTVGVLALLPSLGFARSEKSDRLSNSQLRAIYKALKTNVDSHQSIGRCQIKSLDAGIPNNDRILIDSVWLFVDGAEGDGIGHFSFEKGGHDSSMKAKTVEVTSVGGRNEITVTDTAYSPTEKFEIEKRECRRNPLSCIFHRRTDPNESSWTAQYITRIVWDSSGVSILENLKVDNAGVTQVFDRCAE